MPVLGALILAGLASCEKICSQQAQGTGSFRGYVYCADTNQPARFAKITVQLISSIGTRPGEPEEVPGNAAMSVTDPNGEFTIDRLRPGSYVVLASLRGYVYPLAQFTWRELTVDSNSPAGPVQERVAKVLPNVVIEAGQTATLNIRLERGAEISGAAKYDDGSPVIGAQLTLYRFSESNHKWQATQHSPDAFSMLTTDDRGTFRLTELPPGRYTVSVFLPPSGGSQNAILGSQVRPDDAAYLCRIELFLGGTFRQNRATAIELSSGEVRSGIEIPVPISHFRVLTGTVAAESDGHLLQSASIQLRFADDKSTFIVARLGADGIFKIPFAVDGDFILTVVATPQKDSPESRYQAVDMPISVHGNISGIGINLPDAPIQAGSKDGAHIN